MTEHTLPFDDGTLAYQRTGDGPLIVLSHALGPLAWNPLDRLGESCTVVVPDWERSTVSGNTMGGLRWFEAIATALGFEKAALGAWSMAGPAAIFYAATKPRLLSHLVLVDVAGLGDGLPPLRLWDMPHVILSKLVGHPTRGFVRLLWRNWVHQEGFDTAPLEEAAYRFFRRDDGPEDPSDEDDDEEALVDALTSIEVPTLVLAGQHSTVLGPRHGKSAAAMLPNGQLIVFEESSHTLQLEERVAFQEAVGDFVTEGKSPESLEGV